MVDPRLAQVVAKVFQVDPKEVSMDSNIETIEKWDSLGHVELILQLEQVFGVRFLTEEIPELTSVERLQKALAQKGAL